MIRGGLRLLDGTDSIASGQRCDASSLRAETADENPTILGQQSGHAKPSPPAATISEKELQNDLQVRDTIMSRDCMQDRCRFVLDNADLVSIVHAIRVELILREVIPSLVPKEDAEPFMFWSRFEWGSGSANPHLHGQCWVPANPHLDKTFKDDLFNRITGLDPINAYESFLRTPFKRG